MSTGWKSNKFAGTVVLCLIVLCLGSFSLASANSAQKHHKAKKPELPPLPTGPTGPVPQIPLDSINPVSPQVSFQNGQLTIVAPNSTLGDILRAVRKQTGAEIEIPDAKDRVVTHLGPGPARDVIAELLNGSRFNYVLLGSPEDSTALSRVVLVAKSGPEAVTPNVQPGEQQQQPLAQGNMAPAPQEMAQDAADADAPEENADENADQAAQEAEQQQSVVQPDQPGVKTPQQMLQEMQQRQMQMQQQLPPGSPPIPGAGLRPPQPPQEP